MLNFIDNLLNRITTYRLVLYVVIALWAVAFVFSVFGLLPFSAFSLAFTLVYLLAVSWLMNILFAKVFGTPTNIESIYITVFILALIISPISFSQDPASYIGFLFWAAVWSMVSKYILAIKRKHIFNPAAFAVALTAVTLNQSATWWIGNVYMLPFVLLGGFLIVRKTQRFDMVISFLLTALIAILIPSLQKGAGLWQIFSRAVFYSPILFFAFVMLTEPLTMPPRKSLRIIYGIIVGILFSPATHLGSFYFTPETALLAGNVFAYLVSPKKKLVLKLREKVAVAPGVYDFVFVSSDKNKLNFKPGQYLEWTLGHKKPDNRGNRRYFTIASSPTENEIRLGLKFYPKPSSFKETMLQMKPEDTIIASQLAGEFILPKNKEKKLVFIAGGIGITPFRSMVKYLLDKQENRSIVIFYSNKTKDEIAYQEIFQKAQPLGINTLYAITDENKPHEFPYYYGRIDDSLIKKTVPDYAERMFYISGPHAMVAGISQTLRKIGIKSKNIKQDFFPGLV